MKRKFSLFQNTHGALSYGADDLEEFPAENSGGLGSFDVGRSFYFNLSHYEADFNSDQEPQNGNKHPVVREDRVLDPYFNELNSAVPLTPAQERKIAAKIKKCEKKLEEIKLLSEYLLKHQNLNGNRYNNTKGSDKDTSGKIEILNALSEAYSKLLLELRAKFIKANLRLVLKLARMHMGGDLHYADLIQEGNIGLIRAVYKFDYTLGYKFSTYATWWITQTIRRALKNQSRTIRVPLNLLEQRSKVYKVLSELRKKTSARPLPQDIGYELGLPTKFIERILDIPDNNLKSLDSPLSADEDTTLLDIIPDNRLKSVDSIMSMMEVEKIIEEVLSMLKPREEEVLRMRFGIGFESVYTLEHIAQKYGLTRERIRQIEQKALNKIAKSRRGKDLKFFLLEK